MDSSHSCSPLSTLPLTLHTTSFSFHIPNARPFHLDTIWANVNYQRNEEEKHKPYTFYPKPNMVSLIYTPLRYLHNTNTSKYSTLFHLPPVHNPPSFTFHQHPSPPIQLHLPPTPFTHPTPPIPFTTTPFTTLIHSPPTPFTTTTTSLASIP
ncbi:hypothetical protein Pmani_038670 [Petrolisthes manimaculis]|uniref:Uncharacterized protein n=1 Tax=Petrolisthes manimaculis TaxID=1843537 RepID=A0AAE1NFT9_9EUCA|nr:hypothetical protein Pmani_038670 [Petrolisthes manimaculis]